MKFHIEIECDNEAFDLDNGMTHEVARILHVAAGKLCDWGDTPEANEGFALRDINGNRVGRAWFSDEG